VTSLNTVGGGVCNDIGYLKRLKLQTLALAHFPRVNLMEFMDMAQKYTKVMHSGHVIPLHAGSKLIMKCTTTKSGFLNRKSFTKLDELKMMEDVTRCVDPASLTNHADYVYLTPLEVWHGHKKNTQNFCGAWMALTCDCDSSE
jgi:hypothetical protein